MISFQLIMIHLRQRSTFPDYQMIRLPSERCRSHSPSDSWKFFCHIFMEYILLKSHEVEDWTKCTHNRGQADEWIFLKRIDSMRRRYVIRSTENPGVFWIQTPQQKIPRHPFLKVTVTYVTFIWVFPKIWKKTQIIHF